MLAADSATTHQTASAAWASTTGHKAMPDIPWLAHARTRIATTADIVEQHGRDQSSCGTAVCVLPRKPARNAERKQRDAGDAADRDAGSRAGRCAQQQLHQQDGAVASTRPVAASAAPITARSGLGVPFISAPSMRAVWLVLGCSIGSGSGACIGPVLLWTARRP